MHVPCSDLFVRSANYVYIKQILRDGGYFHLQTVKHPSSVAIIQRTETGFIYSLSHSQL